MSSNNGWIWGLCSFGVRAPARMGRRISVKLSVCALATVLICSLGFAAGSAQADSFTWIGPTSLFSTGGHQSLPTLSCPTTDQCTAVDGQGEQITFDPSTNSILTRSAIDIIGTVSSVSCPSDAQCTAVDNGGNEITFDPSTGKVNQSGRTNVDNHHLTSVSCASGTRCTAVDDHGSEVTFDPSAGTTLNGGAEPIDGTTALTAISCQPGTTPGTQQCTAVDSAGTEVTLILDNGGNPSVSSSPIDGSTPLSSVSCPTTSQCTAVDGNGDEVTFFPTTGVLIGTATQIDSNGGTGVALNSVSCPTASQCVAVDALGNELTFSPTATPAPSVNSVDGTTFLPAVSCPAGASTCVATDNHSNYVSFAADGSGAAVHSIVAPSISGISCPTRNQCTIVESGSSEVTLDPTTGAINAAGVSAIDPSGNHLTSVSCISATECTAVNSGGHELTFDPTSGSILANGSVSIDSSSLRSVSCLVTSGANPAPQCTAVDVFGNEVTFNPSTSAINNAGLSRVDASGGTLTSVSCPTGIQCTAVDTLGNEVTFNPVTGLYLGTEQYVSVDSGQSLDSVSCPTATQCTAVDQAGGVVTFVNPANTPAIPTRQEIELSNTALTSLSCPTSTQCTAVDALGQEGTFDPTSTTLGPGNMTTVPEANSLQAVDCQSTSICFAGDNEGNGFAGIEPPVNSALPTITGASTAQEGVALTAVQGTWTNFPTNYSYQWEDCTSPTDTTTCSPIASNSTSSTYTPVASDIGQYIRVKETAMNPGGSPSVLSAATAKVLPAPPTNTTPPSISGSPVQQGKPLAEVHGTWHEDGSDPLVYSYQWKDCDASGANCTAIAGATGSTYTPTTTDVGHTLVVVEDAANTGGRGTGVASAPTGVVAAAPPPAIQATTLAATNVKAKSATVSAQLVTQGQPVTWAFMYGAKGKPATTTSAQSISAASIPAGSAASPVSVSTTLTGLKPLTSYSFRIVETFAAGPYAPGTTAYGAYLTFKTSSTGKIVLKHTSVKVISGGAASLALSCRSSAACVGGYSLYTTHGNVRCASGTAHVKANHTFNLLFTVTKRCQARLNSAKKHRLSATFKLRPRFGQLPLLAKIKLVRG